MIFVSTRKGISATSAESVFQGLAPDGGLYVPSFVEGDLGSRDISAWGLKECEEYVMEKLFDDLPLSVRADAVSRLLSRFPESDPIPLVEADGMEMLELFHGRTGAFKDVALSMLPVYMRYSAGGKRVLILTATSGDTGSAAMQGFAGVEGTEIIVFYPATGTSRIQKLQMTTPADENVHAVAIKGNFDDAQSAVKRIFASDEMAKVASVAGVTLSSANSINTGRLIPQIAYYILACAKLGKSADVGVDVVVPSGNFGNILAAYYAKKLGAPIAKLVVASNVNDVLARFVKTGVYDPGETFTVTNSPSMDIRKSSNVERLLWMINLGDERDENGRPTASAIKEACDETARLMNDLNTLGRYELNEKAKARLFADFTGGVATPEETECEMRRMREVAGYLLDPHTAVATKVAKDLGYPKDGRKVVVAATATPYKFAETCLRAFGEDVLTDPPKSFADLEKLPIAQTKVVEVDEIDAAVRELL